MRLRPFWVAMAFALSAGCTPLQAGAAPPAQASPSGSPAPPASTEPVLPSVTLTRMPTASPTVSASPTVRPTPKPPAQSVLNAPCGTTSTTTVATASGPIPLTVTYTCYDASGATPDAIRASIDANPARPKDSTDNTDEDALTR